MSRNSRRRKPVFAEKIPSRFSTGKSDKCCKLHYLATNRFERRIANRRCPCRGICGCSIHRTNN